MTDRHAGNAIRAAEERQWHSINLPAWAIVLGIVGAS